MGFIAVAEMVTALSSQPFPSPLRGQILIGTDRHDGGGTDVVMGDVGLALEMVKIDGVGNAVGLIEVFEVTKEVCIVDNPPDVAFEVNVVHGIGGGFKITSVTGTCRVDSSGSVVMLSRSERMSMMEPIQDQFATFFSKQQEQCAQDEGAEDPGRQCASSKDGVS